MELAIIAPVKMLELSNLVDRYHMVLPEGILKSEDYIRFYNDCIGYKILDNGLVEGQQHDGTELNDMARAVGASCIVVPDTYRNATDTIEKVRHFEKHHVNEDLDYMGVIQGLTLDEVVKCIYFYDHTEWITHIAIPRILCDMHKMQRVTLVETMIDMQTKGDLRPDLEFHALGASPWVKEALMLNEAGCHGMDTSLPVVLGLTGTGLDEVYKTRQPTFMDADLDRNSLNWRITIDNCIRYLGWCGISIV